jgi:protein-tyrosine phosphatase
MPKKLLFLCTGNYYRSRFAELVFNHLAQQQNLDWHADSCGLHIAALGPEHPGPISPHTKKALHSRNIPLQDPIRKYKQVCEQDLQSADLVIALKEAEHRPFMEKLHPDWSNKIRYWHIHDLDVATPETALQELESLLHDLIKELKTS